MKITLNILIGLICFSNIAQADILSNELKPGWPSAIVCEEMNDHRKWVFNLTAIINADGHTSYSAVYNNTNRAVIKYNSNGTYASRHNVNGLIWDCADNMWSIDDLEANGRAYYQFYYQPEQ